MKRRRVASSLVLLAVALWLAGCAGAGPAAPGGGGARTRCTPSGPDEQRPLFFLFCVESP